MSIIGKNDMVAATIKDGKTVPVEKEKLKAQEEAKKDYKYLIEIGASMQIKCSKVPL